MAGGLPVCMVRSCDRVVNDWVDTRVETLLTFQVAVLETVQSQLPSSRTQTVSDMISMKSPHPISPILVKKSFLKHVRFDFVNDEPAISTSLGNVFPHVRMGHDRPMASC